MNIIEIIDKKRNKGILSNKEISFVVDSYVKEEIADYQMSALLMAICLNGMTEAETFALTEAMLNSGDKIDLSGVKGIFADKHSTGGIGDKTTLIVAPLVASTGVKVAKMSGRSLGYTGGTIDKLESIEGFKTNLKVDEFIKEINEIGLSITSQTGNLVPADKKIYALRDASGTVESIPLIASSIMSKKLASGANNIVLDVKFGSGALVKTENDAVKLADLMVKIGKNHKRKIMAIITNMNNPLGMAVGNSLEVREAIEVLKGIGPRDITELSLTLASYMVSMSKNISYEEARSQVVDCFKSGKAYEKFLEFVSYQGGNIDNIAISEKVYSIKSSKTGFVKGINAREIGEIVRKLGAGRFNKTDIIDHSVGVVLNKTVGDYVLKDEALFSIYFNKEDLRINDVLECFDIEESLGEMTPLIYKIIK